MRTISEITAVGLLMAAIAMGVMLGWILMLIALLVSVAVTAAIIAARLDPYVSQFRRGRVIVDEN